MQAVEHNQQFLKFCVTGFVVQLALKLLACNQIEDIIPETDVKELATEIVAFVTPNIDRESFDAVIHDGDDSGNDDPPEDGKVYCVCKVPEIGGKKPKIIPSICIKMLHCKKCF